MEELFIEWCLIAVAFFALDGHPALWGHTNWLVLDRQGEVFATYAPFDLLAGLGVRLGQVLDLPLGVGPRQTPFASGGAHSSLRKQVGQYGYS